LDSRITFSRGTGATRVNASGFIEVVGNTTPRFDYDPVTLAPRGLLIEEARTNLLTYSDDWSNAAWTKGGTTVSANATASPDGTTSADKLAEDVTTGTHSTTSPTVALTSGVAYTTTVYVKAAERSWIALQYDSGAFGTSPTAYFNLGTGTVGSAFNGAIHTIRNAGNGWYRCSITATATVSANSTARIYLATGDNAASYTGVTGNGAYLYGAQLEAGAFATSYIPTVASTVSRSADVATMTGTNFSTWYNQSEGTFVASGDSLVAVNTAISSFAIVSDGTNLEYQGIFADNSAGRPQGTTFDGGVVQCDLSNPPFAITPNVPYAASFAYKLNDFGLSTNGSTVATDASGTLPTVNLMGIGNRHGNSRFLSGHIRAIAYYNTRLPNTQLQTLTAPSLASPLALDFISPTYTVGY
jgi:hypothetical protein